MEINKKLKILGIIPARKGSKSIKDKNILLYKSKPLIYHSIKTGLKSKYINRLIVSTDSQKYSKIAKKFGAEVPFLRPSKISKDHSQDREFMIHALSFLFKSEKYFPDLIVHLRPTTPNRKVEIVDYGIKYFLKNIRKYSSMRSVSPFNQPPQKFFKLKKKTLIGYFDKSLKGEYHSKPRQKYSQAFLPNGYIDILKPSYFFLKKNNFYGKKILAFLTEKTLDIDTHSDLK